MRKVMDGYLAGPAGEIDWIESVDTILFGRVTYQLMAGYWPSASATEDDPRIIEAMNDLPKVVFSEWKNSRLVKTEAAEEVAGLKRQPGKNLVIYGSSGLVSELSQQGLIDDYRIFVAPIVLGRGKPMFAGLDARIALRRVEVKSFRTGVVMLRYEPK